MSSGKKYRETIYNIVIVARKQANRETLLQINLCELNK